MALNRYVSGPIPISRQLGSGFNRVDIEFYEIDHSGSSFEARVFLNNQEADETTPKEEASGYAGSFYIFGHGGCFGDAGHCDIPQGPRDPFDRRSPHPLTPQNRTVVVTDALRSELEVGSDNVTVTVVPVASASPVAAKEDLLKFTRLALVTYE